jgi:hypothetical protein
MGEYAKRLTADPTKAEKAFEKAWATRNFEIELYWKRATYFWAFIASAFVGYFGLVNAASYRAGDRLSHAEVYVVICLGFLLSLAWHLTNRGSKQWQRHWEIHVDLLEDQFTGPLYKTVHPELTYSVSKINDIVSAAIAGAWLLLAAKFLLDQNLLHLRGDPNWLIVVATLGTLLFSSAMAFGYGRGRFGQRSVRMFSRAIEFASPAMAQAPTPLASSEVAPLPQSQAER